MSNIVWLKKQKRAYAVETLKGALAKLSEPSLWRKWILREQLPDGRIAYCALGAIQASLAGVDCRVKDCIAISDLPFLAFRQAIDDPNITVWNDAPARRWKEVVAAFKKAIRLAQRM